MNEAMIQIWPDRSRSQGCVCMCTKLNTRNCVYVRVFTHRDAYKGKYISKTKENRFISLFQCNKLKFMCFFSQYVFPQIFEILSVYVCVCLCSFTNTSRLLTCSPPRMDTLENEIYT